MQKSRPAGKLPRWMIPWELPEDPRKPAFLYRAGNALSIQRHVPLPPFGRRYSPGASRPEADRLDYPNDTQTDWCVRFPPQESQFPPHPDGSVRTLHIVDEIACREEHGAQIVRCRLDDDAGETFYVAKIYDALYYPSREWGGAPLDTTYSADAHYSCECAAYEHLSQAGVDGRYTPKYFGSWTFDAPIPSVRPTDSAQVGGGKDYPTSRPVRMILTGWIRGTSMYSYLQTNKVNDFPYAWRLEVLAKAIESESKLVFHGLLHNDFEPRNVLVVDAEPPATSTSATRDVPDVYIIDFNISYVLDSPYMRPKYQRSLRPTLPGNPMHEYWNNTCENFGSWVPVAYRRNRAAFRGWLKSRWGEAQGYSEPHELMKQIHDYNAEVVYIPPESIPLDEAKVLDAHC
ncbi:Protein kinase-like domain protein [Niveomyces insectorum RCEF 264]|uniref:Protein kinase-like domain protein n=1 Tax=Niveomyces insectorum RCEF 264 TaxID=1081102 RepID=A0A167RDM7_9HYPO|nr:Protein kinase-like domain protein [Niveomyces insectorum RCEF 264]